MTVPLERASELYVPGLRVIRPEDRPLSPVPFPRGPEVVTATKIEFEDPPHVSTYIHTRRSDIFNLGREEELRNMILWRVYENQHNGDYPVYAEQERIHQPGQIPQVLNILNEWWLIPPEKGRYALLEQYLWNPYNMIHAHHGRYHNGYMGGEARVVRAFMFDQDEKGQQILVDQRFIKDRHELTSLDQSFGFDRRFSFAENPGKKTIIADHLFPKRTPTIHTPDYDIVEWSQSPYGKVGHVGLKKNA